MSNQVDEFREGVGKVLLCNHDVHVRGCPGDCWRRPKESSMDVQAASMTANPVDPPEMALAIDALTGSLTQLQETVSVLSAKLGPLLNSGTPSEVMPDVASLDAEYPDKINKLAYAVSIEHRKLGELIRRLEV